MTTLKTTDVAELIINERSPGDFEHTVREFFHRTPIAEIIEYVKENSIPPQNLKRYYYRHIKNGAPNATLEQFLSYFG
ncbi:hypothetical protein [Limisalsivibrio acetivorans]|uniref:hypothetical protein n=1 Tax=Limisalsivibrio acetivorans TaxID=1304888 RepID=UPI0003B3B655|nr:hypothetical protein [Limisalsivibrio acetivorans]